MVKVTMKMGEGIRIIDSNGVEAYIAEEDVMDYCMQISVACDLMLIEAVAG